MSSCWRLLGSRFLPVLFSSWVGHYEGKCNPNPLSHHVTCFGPPLHYADKGKAARQHGILQPHERVFQLVGDNGSSSQHGHSEMDRLGGSVSRTPSPGSLADPAHGLEMVDVFHGSHLLAGWLMTAEAPAEYMPVNIAGECMWPNFMNARYAAHWFLLSPEGFKLSNCPGQFFWKGLPNSLRFFLCFLYFKG